MANKTAFIFPGQGSQYVGMAKDFYESYKECRDVFEMASDVTGIDLKELCFTENDKLNITEYTQIAMITAEIGMLKCVELTGVKPYMAAGLSLGEYGALSVSGAMKEEDIFRLIKKRGIYMQNAMPVGGAMMAIVGGDVSMIEEVCAGVEGVVSIANYNTYEQHVISGEQEAVKAAAKIIKEKGAKRCLPLNVSGPFHTSLLADAADKLGQELDKIDLCDISAPYIANCTADIVEDNSVIKELLRKQICSPVKWYQSVEKMTDCGIDTFVEIGPGKSLTKMIKKIAPDANAISIENMNEMEALKSLIG